MRKLSEKKDKEIEVVINNKVFTAELFQPPGYAASKTCELVLNALPLDHTTTKDGGLVHTCIFGWSILARWPKTAAPFTVPQENSRINLKKGFLYWQTYDEPMRDERFETSLNELVICYRAGYGGCGPQGLHCLNEFGRITDKLDELAAIGNDLYSKPGQRTILVRRKK